MESFLSKIRKIFSGEKKLIYVICFAILGLIDFAALSLNGDYASVASNATGVILFIIIMTAFPQGELKNLFSVVWSIICAAAFLIALSMHKIRYFDIYSYAFFLMLFNIWWIILLGKTVFLRVLRNKEKKFSLMTLLWIVLTFLMTIGKCDTYWHLFYFGGFSIFFLTSYEKEKKEMMLDGMLDGIILSFFLLQIYAFGFRPYDELRYRGAYGNFNMTSLHYLVTYTAVLLKLNVLHVRKAAKGWRVFYFLGAATLLCFLFLALGRSSWMAATIITLLYGIFVMRGKWKEKWKKIVLRAVALGLVALILFPGVFAMVRWFPTILHHPIWLEGEYNIEKVHSFDPPDSPKYVDFNEFFEGFFLRTIGTFQARSPFVLKAYAAGPDDTEKAIPLWGTDNMDISLRHRVTTIKIYVSELNLMGHNGESGHYLLEGPTFRIWHSQNLWLQVAYVYGIPAGILFLVITILIISRSIRILCKGGEKEWCIVPLFICAAFFLYGMLELVWREGQMILFLFFFVQHPFWSVDTHE